MPLVVHSTTKLSISFCKQAKAEIKSQHLYQDQPGKTFLSRACERGFKLNPTKTELRHTSVLFVGYILTDRDIAADPEKTAF